MRITLLVVENCCWRLCTPLLDLLGCGLCAAGCLCKKTLGTAGGGLVHTVMNELGPDVTRYTINNIQFTVNYWLLQVQGWVQDCLQRACMHLAIPSSSNC